MLDLREARRIAKLVSNIDRAIEALNGLPPPTKKRKASPSRRGPSAAVVTNLEFARATKGLPKGIRAELVQLKNTKGLDTALRAADQAKQFSFEH